MNLQTSISVIVCVALIHFARVETVLSELHKLELANKLNAFLLHPGWRTMYNVQIEETLKVDDNTTYQVIGTPMSEIYEALSAGRAPVDEHNVLRRYDQIWTVLRCKYAEVIERYRIQLKHFMAACRIEKRRVKIRRDPTHRRYLSCFHSLLNTLDAVSPTFNRMTDALAFFYTMGPQSGPNQGVAIATRKLAVFTRNIMPDTLSSLTIGVGIEKDAVDIEIKAISKFFADVVHLNVHWFIGRQCNVPSPKNWIDLDLKKDFVDKKKDSRIRMKTTMVEYVQTEIDCFVNAIADGVFKNLGFAYDGTGNVIIANN